MASVWPSTTSGHKSEKGQVQEANYQILKTIGPLQITHTKRANEVIRGDFVVIEDRPCRVSSTTSSTTGNLHITGHAILPLRGELPNRYNYAGLEMTVDATDEIPVPKVNFLFVGHIYTNEYLAIDDRPCRVIDMNRHRAGYGFKIHIIGMDIFTGNKMESLIDSILLIPRLEAKWEHKQLLSISEDFFCSLIGENNIAEENIRVHNEAFGKAIKDFWADGERNVIVRTAKSVGIEGVVAAWEVVEMKLLGAREAGMLGFENVETGVSIDVQHPTGEKGEEIGGLLEDVDKGREVMMEIHVPMRMESTIRAVDSTIRTILIGKEVRGSVEELSSGWTLVER